MATQDNTIDIDNEKNSLVIYHLNRLLIVGLSAIALSLNGYQTPDTYYGASIVIWLWLPEIEVLERKIARTPIKQFSIVFLSCFMVIAIYMLLGNFVEFIQWLSGHEVWVLLAILVMAGFSLVYKTIVLLAINNPVKNIGKEFRTEALK
jgi:hypothetical protein